MAFTRKNPALKNFIYLVVLSAVLFFALYNLFSDNAKSWFVSNKSVKADSIYGRVITSGAGKNLSSFKNDDIGSLDSLIMEDWEGDGSYLIMVPGDIIHFIFMVSVPDPGFISGSQLSLQEIYGQQQLRDNSRVFADSIKVSEVSVTEVQKDGDYTYEYFFSNTWQPLTNSKLDTLYSDQAEINIQVGAVQLEGTMIEVGAYAGEYVYLVDIPIYYIDTGENQNAEKGEYSEDDQGNYVPVEDSDVGVIIIARCVFSNVGTP